MEPHKEFVAYRKRMGDLEELIRRASSPVVRLPGKGGHGVLVPGGFIVTAAHCIGWTSEGSMVFDDSYMEDVESCSIDLKMKARPVAVEPVKDIAVLSGLDEAEFSSEAEIFDAFVAGTNSIPICTEEFPLSQPLPVLILTHDRGWIDGEAKQTREGASALVVSASGPIRGGTSGCPIVDRQGRLLGIVSYFSEAEKPTGAMPRPHLAAPAWAVREMLRAQGGD